MTRPTAEEVSSVLGRQVTVTEMRNGTDYRSDGGFFLSHGRRASAGHIAMCLGRSRPSDGRACAPSGLSRDASQAEPLVPNAGGA